jgi:hypothetical protein
VGVGVGTNPGTGAVAGTDGDGDADADVDDGTPPVVHVPEFAGDIYPATTGARARTVLRNDVGSAARSAATVATFTPVICDEKLCTVTGPAVALLLHSGAVLRQCVPTRKRRKENDTQKKEQEQRKEK